MILQYSIIFNFSASEYQSSRGYLSSARTKGSTWGKEGSFASEDIRYRKNEQDIKVVSSSMSGISVSDKDIAEQDFDSEYELPPSGSSVCSFSVRSSPGSARSSIMSGAGRGALLNKLKDTRRSRMVANLND